MIVILIVIGDPRVITITGKSTSRLAIADTGER